MRSTLPHEVGENGHEERKVMLAAWATLPAMLLLTMAVAQQTRSAKFWSTLIPFLAIVVVDGFFPSFN